MTENIFFILLGLFLLVFCLFPHLYLLWLFSVGGEE